jgi:hypothetical protein
LRGKITLVLLIIFVISLADASFLVSAPQSPVTQETSSSSGLLADSPTPMQSPSSPTSPSSISAQAYFGFGGSFEANYTFPSRNLTINGNIFWCGNINLLITYSIDGSENCTLPIEMKLIDPNFIAQFLTLVDQLFCPCSQLETTV